MLAGLKDGLYASVKTLLAHELVKLTLMHTVKALGLVKVYES